MRGLALLLLLSACAVPAGPEGPALRTDLAHLRHEFARATGTARFLALLSPT